MGKDKVSRITKNIEKLRKCSGKYYGQKHENEEFKENFENGYFHEWGTAFYGTLNEDLDNAKTVTVGVIELQNNRIVFAAPDDLKFWGSRENFETKQGRKCAGEYFDIDIENWVKFDLGYFQRWDVDAPVTTTPALIAKIAVGTKIVNVLLGNFRFLEG